MIPAWPALAAVGLLCAVEAREARTTVAAVASLGRGPAVRAAVLPALALVTLTGAAVTVLVLLPRRWAEPSGGVVVLVAGLQWLLWAARRELGAVPSRDEVTVFDEVASRPAAVRTAMAGALLRAGGETLVVATAVAAAGVPRLWLPPLVLLVVAAAVVPGFEGRHPAAVACGITGRRAPTVLPERKVKAAVAVLLTATGAVAVTSGAVGVPLALLLPGAGLFALTKLRARREAVPPAPGHRARVSPARALRDFVLGDDLAVWWAAAALVVAVRLPWAAFHRGPAAALLLTALLAALIGGTARRRPRTESPGGDR
ncbi:hypothetical protein OK074_1763 [Actinobacteria bacterium OK074]|nr:hypothetical protein OK074_1763 [Actinobacteria bacterium OK074]